MGNSALWWIVCVASSMISGFAIVGVLVLRRRMEPLASLAVIVSGALSALALVAIARAYMRADALLYAFAFELAAVGGGYSLASTLLFKFVKPLTPLVLPADPPSADPRVSVMVTCCIEPQHYDPGATAGMLESLTQEGLLEQSVGGLPFLFFAHKARYRAVDDSSPARPELEELARRLQEALAEHDVVVDWASCSADSRLAVRVAEAISEGHTKLIVTTLAVAPSTHLQRAVQEADDLVPEAGWASLVHAESLVASDRILEMLADRVMTQIEGATKPGVVLVGHGQPEEREKRSPVMSEGETVFLSRLRVSLAERGLGEDSVRIAWSEWVEPGVTSQVRHLAALGGDRILVVPAVFPLDTLSTRIDLELAAAQAHLDESVTTMVLPAWGADDAVVEELKTLVLRAMNA